MADVHIRFSTRAHGDFHLDQDPQILDARRRRFVDLPWSQPDEHHGTEIGTVCAPGDGDRARVDGLVTDHTGAVIGIWVGDCAPLALVGDSGRIGGVHVGWRGLRDGIIARAVAAMRHGCSAGLTAVLGPCIHPCCYEFGDDDLTRLQQQFGAHVRAATAAGRPALDLPAATAAALRRLDVDVDDRSRCTGCHSDELFSHRVRGERERQVMAVWRA
jgi:hypothetical protein